MKHHKFELILVTLELLLIAVIISNKDLLEQYIELDTKLWAIDECIQEK